MKKLSKYINTEKPLISGNHISTIKQFFNKKIFTFLLVGSQLINPNPGNSGRIDYVGFMPGKNTQCTNSFEKGSVNLEIFQKISHKVNNMDPIFKELVFIPKNDKEVKKWFKMQKLENRINEIRFQIGDNSQVDYENMIIPIDSIKECKEQDSHTDTLGFFSPDRDIIGLLYKKYGAESIEAIYHETWHSIYDNTGEKKGLIFTDGYTGPKEKEINEFVNKYFLQRPDIKDVFYSNFQYSQLRQYSKKIENSSIGVKKISTQYNSLNIKYRKFIINIVSLILEINNSYDKNLLLKGFFSSDLINIDKFIKIYEKKLGILFKEHLLDIAYTEKLGKNKSNDDLLTQNINSKDSINLITNKINLLSVDISILIEIITDLKSIVDNNNLDDNILKEFIMNGSNLILEINMIINSYKNLGLGEYIGNNAEVLTEGIEYEKLLKEYYLTPNEIMARIVDSLYSKNKGNTKNKFLLDEETLLFLEQFKFKGVNIFKEGIRKYREILKN